jgi:hypothetical protein
VDHAETRVARQQIASIKKLCSYLDRELPALDSLTETEAGKPLQELSAAYKGARSALPVR